MSRSRAACGCRPTAPREIYGELAVVPPNVRHTIASDYRSVICVLIEPESVGAGALDALARRLSGAGTPVLRQPHPRGLRSNCCSEPCGDDIGSAAFDIMCFGEALPRRSLDPRVVRAIAQIGRFSGEPVTAASCAAEAGLSVVALPASVQAGDRYLVPRVPRLETRAASAAFRQSGPQPRASGAGYRLSRLDPFQPFDPPLLRPEAARDLFRLARSRDLPQRSRGR